MRGGLGAGGSDHEEEDLEREAKLQAVPRVCDECGLPFGFRDTGGVYRTGNGSGQTFAWGAATSDADGATTYHARLGGTLALAFTFARNGTPTAQRSAQLGWPRLLVETALCPV